MSDDCDTGAEMSPSGPIARMPEQEAATTDPVTAYLAEYRPAPLPGAVLWSDPPAADRLAAMIADLDGYIARKAAEIARPKVEEAKREAGKKVRAAQADAQRWKDCNAEMRRQMDGLERQVETTRAEIRASKEARREPL